MMPSDLSSRTAQSVIAGGAKPVRSITIANKKSLWGYRGDDASPFIKITITDQKHMAKTRNVFEKGEVQYKSLFPAASMTTYESNIAYTLRFMIDLKVRRRLRSGIRDREIRQSRHICLFLFAPC